MCIKERKLRILFLYEYSAFHLELLTTPTLVMIETSFECQMMLGWYVEKTKSGLSRAEFYKRLVLTTEVSSLMFLS